MANSLSNIMPKILARGLMALRQQAWMPRLVNGDYSNDAAAKGDTIDVPVPVAQTASAVTPAATPPTAASKTPTKVQIPLNQWQHTDFHLTDKELGEIDRNAHFMPMQMSEAVKALANAINVDIWDEYKGVYGYTGTAATTPFASDVSDATGLRKVLHEQLCPRDLRRAVIDFSAEANALILAPFRDASQSTDRDVVIEGEIGRKFGFDWFADDHVPTHTAGTASLDADVIAIDQTDVAVGDASVTIDVDAGTSTVVIGDIFTVAGDSQTYVATAIATLDTAGVAVAFDPPAKIAWADDAVVTFKATHVVNLGFHRNAIAFAMRPLMQDAAALELGNRMMSMQDPQTGIVLRLEISRQYKQTVWDFDVLWGTKLVRADLACRLAG